MRKRVNLKEPSVVILWLLKDRLLIDSTPIEMAETDLNFVRIGMWPCANPPMRDP